jgi:hypothetical protein
MGRGSPARFRRLSAMACRGADPLDKDNDSSFC